MLYSQLLVNVRTAVLFVPILDLEDCPGLPLDLLDMTLKMDGFLLPLGFEDGLLPLGFEDGVDVTVDRENGVGLPLDLENFLDLPLF